MKLCITATGNDLNAATDAAFGRAPWFMLVDTETGTSEGIENSTAQSSQGAGIAAAQTMTEHEVDAVLTGRLGPKAKAALEASGVGMYEGLGRCTVAEALEQFRAGVYGYGGGSGQAQADATTGASPSSAPSSETASPGRCTGPGAVRGQGRGRGGGNCGCGGGAGRGQGRGR
ncbi:MAG: dinitrogenase iron-molybdenum cofactor biosynthesis protein [Candidatus Electrothrix sp. AUS4]|nr:dinitrogenase iron-molybdenum cofactor biosynthesis protein [Candidatus Electrothrix sp. AUS4]